MGEGGSEFETEWRAGMESLDLRHGRVAWRRGAGAAGHGAVGLRRLRTCGEYRSVLWEKVAESGSLVTHFNW